MPVPAGIYIYGQDMGLATAAGTTYGRFSAAPEIDLPPLKVAAASTITVPVVQLLFSSDSIFVDLSQ